MQKLFYLIQKEEFWIFVFLINWRTKTALFHSLMMFLWQIQTMSSHSENGGISFFWSWSYWSTFLLTWYASCYPVKFIWLYVALLSHPSVYFNWIVLFSKEGQLSTIFWLIVYHVRYLLCSLMAWLSNIPPGFSVWVYDVMYLIYNGIELQWLFNVKNVFNLRNINPYLIVLILFSFDWQLALSFCISAINSIIHKACMHACNIFPLQNRLWATLDYWKW